MIPVYVKGQRVGYLPDVQMQPGLPLIRFAIRPTPLSVFAKIEDVPVYEPMQTVDLQVRDQRHDGVPGELHAKDFRGLLSLTGFEPEDKFLPQLTQADLRR